MCNVHSSTSFLADRFLLLIHAISLPNKRIITHPYHNTPDPKPPPSTPSNFDDNLANLNPIQFLCSLSPQLASHRITVLPDELHNFLLRFCSWP
jgi:hypothetical protein